MLIFCNVSLTEQLSTCPLSTPSARWRWRSVRSMTSPIQTETGPLTTWLFMCRFSFWSHCQTSDFFPHVTMLLPPWSHPGFCPWWASSSSLWAPVASNLVWLRSVETSLEITRLGWHLYSTYYLLTFSFRLCFKTSR